MHDRENYHTRRDDFKSHGPDHDDVPTSTGALPFPIKSAQASFPHLPPPPICLLRGWPHTAIRGAAKAPRISKGVSGGEVRGMQHDDITQEKPTPETYHQPEGKGLYQKPGGLRYFANMFPIIQDGS